MDGLRERILGSRDLKRKTIPVPEWDLDVTVRELTYPERARYYKEAVGSAAIRKAARAAIEAPADLAEPAKADEPPPEIAAEEEQSEIADYTVAKGRLAALAICMAVVDETGARVFGDDDLEALAQRSPDVLDRLHIEIAILSGLGPTGEKAVEQDSERTLSDAPSSTSPSPSGEPRASSNES